MSDDPLVLATYALVVATALLVIASGIPAAADLVRIKRERRGRAARVVPDMNLLHSRLVGQARRYAELREMALEALDAGIHEGHRNMHFIGRIIEDSFDVSLKFSNEMYLARHFITAAIDDLKFLARRQEEITDQESEHDLVGSGHHPHHTHGDLSEEARIGKITANLLAADTCLQAGESLLPKAVRSVDGKSFWDRYSDTLERRTNEAEKALVDLRSRRKSRAS